MADPVDPRSNLEKLDDLQAQKPFRYNLLVGLLLGAVLLLLGVHPVLVVLYAVTYAGLRWFFWQGGRVLRRQYAARSQRWAEQQADRRRRH